MLPAPPDRHEAIAYEPSPLALALAARAADGESEEPGQERDPDVAALRLGAAAIDYYPREAKSYWQGHFQRLREPLSLWADTRDVIAIDAARSRVVEDWHVPEEGRRIERRLVELRGDVAPGTRLREGANPFVLYGRPAPFAAEVSPRWIHVPRSVRVVAELDDGVVVEETSIGGETWRELPLAVTPAAPPRAGNQQLAIDAWAESVIDAGIGRFPEDAATDLLRRRPPRTRSGALPAPDGDDVAAITAAVLDLDRSYLAVQGPPGTGKTFVGSHVIARLVRDHGFKVGVVAQSHAVVEHMLERIVAAGVPAMRVGKAPKEPGAAVTLSLIHI